MHTRLPFTLALLPALAIAPLTAHAATHEDDDKMVRNLRVVLAGTRPLPVYEKRGGKFVEVDPPKHLIPPTSFAFTNAAHAPRQTANNTAQNQFSAWPGELIKIAKYKGPSALELSLKNPILSPNSAGETMSCNLGKSTDPLILIHPSFGSDGWNQPQSKVIDMSPKKLPARSIVVANLSTVALKVYLTPKGVIVPPNKHIVLKAPSHNKEAIRYKVDASNGKKLTTVTNSSYRLDSKSRLIMLALPGKKTKSDAFALPELKMITDKVSL